MPNNESVGWACTVESSELVALSTCEGELMAACEGFLMGRSNGELMKELFGGCGLSRELGPGLLLAVDNMAAVGILGNESSGNWRTRHLKVRSAAIHQALEEKVVKVAHFPGTEQIADIGTKTLPATTLNQLKALMGMESLSKLELLEKQKEGKKRMKQVGNVEISQEAFLSVLDDTED